MVGLGIGALLMIVDRVATAWFAPVVAAVMTVTVWKIVTGGVHLSAGRRRTRRALRRRGRPRGAGGDGGDRARRGAGRDGGAWRARAHPGHGPVARVRGVDGAPPGGRHR